MMFAVLKTCLQDRRRNLVRQTEIQNLILLLNDNDNDNDNITTFIVPKKLVSRRMNTSDKEVLNVTNLIINWLRRL